MGAGACAGIVLTPPIDEVVARFRSLPRMVGDLVSRKTGRLAQLLRDEVKFARACAIWDAQAARRMARGKRRAGLDGQLIEREMVLRVSEGAGELLAPGADALPLAAIDQVEGDAVESALGDGECGKRLLSTMHAAERFEVRIIERLHAERDPVDAGQAVAGEALRLDARWIGLERDLGVGVKPPKLGDSVEDRRDRRGSH